MAYLLLLFSGFAALVYQVVWTRELGLILGQTVYAVTAVLIAFMGGLALGSYAIGRLIGRAGNPLRVFALLEVGVAVTALAFPIIVTLLDPIYARFYEAVADRFYLFNAGRLALAIAVLLVPATLMGGTLPAASAWVVPPGASGSTSVGSLYAVNTIGATIGCLMTGFVLIERLGVIETQLLAAGVNLTAAALAVWSARNWDSAPARRATPARPRSRGNEPTLVSSTILLTALAVSGAAALGYEVIWTRALVFHAGTTTYAFTTMLAIYLSGLASGSLAAARWVPSFRRPIAMFAGVQVALAVLVAFSVPLLGSASQPIERWIPSDASWSSLVASNLLKAGVTMFVPTFLLGALFPIAVRLAGGVERAGPRVGRLYAANTWGAIAGAALTGFVLIPAVGLQRALLIGATMNIAVAALVFVAGRSARDMVAPGSLRWRVIPVVGGSAVLALVLWLVVPHQIQLHRLEGSEALLYYAEGNTATVSVVREVSGTKTLYIDRVPVAGTDTIMLTDQKSLAHLPMLLHPDPREVLTVGFGSGGASWSFSTYDRLEHIDCVEIDPAVFGAAPHLVESNHEVWRDPRFRLILEDARSYLAFSDRTYDIISTDCTDLRYKSNASLYTTDYFQLCRRRLRPDGMVVVWMPLGGLADDVFRMALRTFQEVFPHATVWYMPNYPTHYALLIGTLEPLRIDIDRVLERLAEADVRADLQEIGLASPEKLLNGLLLDEEGYAAYTGPGNVNRDRYPYLEFIAPRRAYRFALSRNLSSLAARRTNVTRHVEPPRTAAGHAVLERLRDGQDSTAALLAGHAIYQRETFEYSAALEEYRRAAELNPTDATLENLIAAVTATRNIWIAEYQHRLASGNATPDDRVALGALYADVGRLAEAEQVLRAALRGHDRHPLAHRALGAVLARSGKPAEAISAYERALALDPTSAEAQNDLGLLYLDRRDLTRAEAAFRRAVALDGASASAHHNLGVVLAQQGDLAGAEAAYRAALRSDPRLVEAYGNLAVVLARTERRQEAIRALETLLDIDPSVSVARQMLAQLRQEDPP